jgi:hypothetical protein
MSTVLGVPLPFKSTVVTFPKYSTRVMEVISVDTDNCTFDVSKDGFVDGSRAGRKKNKPFCEADKINLVFITRN